MITAGAAKVAITPPVGIELAGYSFGPSVGILDELEAQALVLAVGETKTAIITVDLLTVGVELVANVRRRVEQQFGIPGEAVVVAASHSHSTPTAHSLRQWGPVDSAYITVLESALVGAVKMACDRLQPASLGIGVGRADNLSENRRGLSEIRDLAVPVLRVDREDGSPLAVLFNFSCHPVSLHCYRNLISPDYPGYTRRVLRKVLGEDVVAMFTLGAAGDINPAGFKFKDTNPVHSRKIGDSLGCEAARVALDPWYEEAPVLRTLCETISLPVVPLLPVEDLEKRIALHSAEADRLRAEGGSWEQIAEQEIQRDWAADALRVVQSGQVNQAVTGEIQVIRMGDAVLLAAPFEIFTETSLAIKKASPARVTLISSNSNGGVGYLPTADAYTVRDYTNPEGMAPKIYGIYALSEKAEPLFRQEAIRLIQKMFV